jgi:hypothetical protein
LVPAREAVVLGAVGVSLRRGKLRLGAAPAVQGLYGLSAPTGLPIASVRSSAILHVRWRNAVEKGDKPLQGRKVHEQQFLSRHHFWELSVQWG